MNLSSFPILKSKKEITATNIEIKNLIPYKEHPFKLYEGQRFLGMVESIKANGVVVPVIVRPVEGDGFTYEILSGHNRVNAAREAGLSSVPCIVKEGLTDNEAQLIVTESNLIQRSFTDLRPSEKAAVIFSNYNAVKQQGKRNDLVAEIEQLEKTFLNPGEASNNQENGDLSPMETKLQNAEKPGEKYDLSRANAARYLRVYELTNEFKNLLDEEKLSVRAGVELSYLSIEMQKLLYAYVSENGVRIDMFRASQIKKLFQGKKLNSAGDIEKVFNPPDKKKRPSKNLSFTRKNFSRFFKGGETDKEIEGAIISLLEQYY